MKSVQISLQYYHSFKIRKQLPIKKSFFYCSTHAFCCTMHPFPQEIKRLRHCPKHEQGGHTCSCPTGTSHPPVHKRSRTRLKTMRYCGQCHRMLTAKKKSLLLYNNCLLTLTRMWEECFGIQRRGHHELLVNGNGNVGWKLSQEKEKNG